MSDPFDRMDAAIFASPIAVDATYTPAGGGNPVITRVIIDFGVEPFPGSFDSKVSEPHTEISLQVKDVGIPKRGATVTVGAAVYTVKALLANDGRVCRVVVI